MRVYTSATFLLFLSLITIKAQPFIPLSVGNEYVYNVITYDTLGNILSSGIDTLCIDSDTLILGERWFSLGTHYYTGANYYTNRDSGLWKLEKATGLSYLDWKYPALVGNIYTTPDDSIFVLAVDTTLNITSGSFSCIHYQYRSIQGQYLTSRFIAPGYFQIYGIGYEKTQEGMWYPSTSLELLSYSIINNLNEDIIAPSDYIIEQNYPNPFNPRTKIEYKIPELNFVTLKIYDVLGNEVTMLVNQEKPVGSYEVEFNGTGLPSGVYFYQLRAGDYVQTKKMILLK